MFDYQSFRRFLVVAAHHDDESLFFGGTLSNIAQRNGGREIRIVVLTGVQHENPPVTPEQEANEPVRQRRRLMAFGAVCTALDADPECLRLPQVNRLSAPDAHALEEMAYSNLVSIFRQCEPDCILTHGREGEYTAEKYAKGWEDARAQHQLAYRLVRRLPQEVFRGQSRPPVKWGYDLFGEVPVQFDREAKMRLLGFYRYGCTQTAKWRPELTYPEFVATERFTVIE